jgi:integrase
MKLKLDTKTVAGLALAKGRGEDFAWDTELEGFGLRLRRRRDGDLLRTWAAQYRANGHTRRITLGSVEKVTVTQARDAARKVLARVALGHDPQGEKRAKRAQSARTFRSAVEAYLAAKQPELRPVSHRINKLYLLDGDYLRPLHPFSVNEIAHPDIAARLSTITRNHSAHTAAAARRAVSAAFRWFMEEGWTTANPVIGTRKPDDPKPREHVLSNAELVRVWKACGDDDFGRIVRLLILLGSRRQEIGGMRWSELDLDAGAWTLPAERSKNHRPHTIALPPAALAIIKSVPQTSRNHLFGDRADDGFTSWSRFKRELDRRLAGRVKPFRIHDLRRTAATGMADIGVEPHHIEAALNHFSGHRRGVAGVYNRSSYERAVGVALARWSEHVLALVEGRESNVVALQRA